MQKGGCGSQGDKKCRKDKRLSIPDTQITINIPYNAYTNEQIFVHSYPKVTESHHRSRARTFLKYKIIYYNQQTI